jgi:hypothetical protein
MINRCDICIDPEKGCNRHCKGESCKSWKTCHRSLRPTIRITTKCTQECDHCCFDCSPSRNEMMTVETATVIASFLKHNQIESINLMGGEFFCNPQWSKILRILIHPVCDARLVSNGDWVANKETTQKLLSIARQYPLTFRVGISKDKWHSNQFVEEAIRILENNGVICNRGQDQDDSNDFMNFPIVPVGRSSFEYCLYSTFSCYCHKPEHRYSFLIDEAGRIYKCAFGKWDYSNVKDYAKGGFSQAFVEHGKCFDGIFIANCKVCSRAYDLSKKEGAKT